MFAKIQFFTLHKINNKILSEVILLGKVFHTLRALNKKQLSQCHLDFCLLALFKSEAH